MKHFGLTGAVFAAIITMGCGDSGGDSPDASSPNFIDAASSDGTVAVACNPVQQTGCTPDEEKCANVLVTEEPARSVTKCVPNGDIAPKMACETGEAGFDTGYDNCKGGYECRNGLCREICNQAPNSCSDEPGNCVLISSKFQDLDSIGVCAQRCDPVMQDCADETEACYLNAALGESSCSRIPEETDGITQGQDCYGPETDTCYLNGCPKGFGALLNKGGPDGPGGSVCAAYCTPSVLHKDLADLQDKLNGDPAGTTCASMGAIAPHECRFVNSFYSNTQAVPDTVGFCVDPTEGWDSCAQHTLDSVEAETNVPGCQPLSSFPMSNAAPRGRALPKAPERFQLPNLGMATPL